MQANGLFLPPGRFKDTPRRTGAPIGSHWQAVSVGWLRGAHRACPLSVNLCPARSEFLIDGHMPFYRFIGKATSARKLSRQKRIVQQRTAAGQGRNAPQRSLRQFRRPARRSFQKVARLGLGSAGAFLFSTTPTEVTNTGISQCRALRAAL
jgi:hypothetical protein